MGNQPTHHAVHPAGSQKMLCQSRHGPLPSLASFLFCPSCVSSPVERGFRLGLVEMPDLRSVDSLRYKSQAAALQAQKPLATLSCTIIRIIILIFISSIIIYNIKITIVFFSPARNACMTTATNTTQRRRACPGLLLFLVPGTMSLH